MKQKKPSASSVIKTEIVCPNDTNPMGILQGGKLVHWMDIAAAVCAQTHAEHICVTATINQISFNKSAIIGDIITIKAKVTRAFITSLEIKVEAFSRNIKSKKDHLIGKSYFVFVALDESKNQITIPKLLPQTKSEIEDYKNALIRKNKINGATKS
ncbi:MAG: acyl-CoA thioesterase [Chitinophagaceae bacterium]|nr:acyl-CoA thioesterase [Chitinophagaceae bacterium]